MFSERHESLNLSRTKNGYNLRTIEAAVKVNLEQKTKLFWKATNRMISFSCLKIAVLGLTFKPGTDDLREAPALDNVNLLLEAGGNIFAYDPVGTANFKKCYPEGRVKNGSIYYTDTPEKALKDANICFIFTEWKEIREIRPTQYYDLMQTPLVYDGRNIYELNDMKNARVEYHSIGR